MSYIVQHMKGPKVEGKREKILYPTKTDLVEGLDEKLNELAENAGETEPASDEKAGLMSAADKEKLDGIEAGANNYSLPQASESKLGGVKLYESTGKNIDGTMTQKAITEAIASSGSGGGADTLVLSTNTLEVKVGETNTFAVATTSSDTVVVSSDKTNIATAEIDGNTITVTGVRLGYATITVTAGNLSATCTAIVSKTKVTIPTVTNTSKTYTGEAQSPTIENEPPTSIATVTGKSASSVGNHELTYALVDENRYEWADNTTGAKIFGWSISRATGNLSISASTGTIYKGSTGTFTITTPSDGAITVTSNNTAVATVRLDGKTVTVTGVKTGTATITVSQTEGTNYTAPTNATYTATIDLYVDSTLNNNSWETISEISQRGTGDTYWDVGDAKEITLTGKIGNQLTLANEKLCVFILHFNYKMNGTAENNIIWGGFKSALTNGKDVALADAKYNTTLTDGTVCFTMNHKGQMSTSGSAGYYNTNYGGWKGSDLRYDILGATSTAPSQYNQNKSTSNVGYDATAATLTSPKADTLLAALPSDLRSAMRLWTRWIDAVGNSSNVDANIKATVDAITLLAEFEVQGARSYANEYEKNHQTQMAYYNAGNSKVRYSHSDTSSAVYWWCASPFCNGNADFCCTSTSGGASYTSAYRSYALAPAFKT